jgi:uncharacterized protein (UPF0332 family)
MTWTQLLANRDVQRHETSKRELDEMDAITLALGAAVGPYADYLETCRRKRNVIDYTRAAVATDSEAEEIVSKAKEFHELVETWIGSKFARLKR